MSEHDLKHFAESNPAPPGAVRSSPHYVDLAAPYGTPGGAAAHPFAKRTAAGNFGGGANVIRTIAKPYHPLFSSPDRLQLPVQLAQLNQYWRLFYNVDPIIGGVIDMHAEMPFSNAYLTMENSGDTSKEILHAYEDMLNETELLSWLPRIVREYFIIGEVFPFCFWDDDEGIWSHIVLHNPDYVEVVSSPLVDDEPILTLRPTQDLRRLVQSKDPRYVRLRQKIPPKILAQISSGRNIPLDSLNASHIKRAAFPYDIRGTSILNRLFRILMYEDAVFQGQIQQAQRHALPLRVFKLGDPQTGWMPTPQNQADFAELLAEIEVDPLAALIYSYGLQVEYHGIEGKQLKITQEWDIIERAKLIALGVSKAFLHGEVTYASANAGLQVLMLRYRTLRDMLLNDWIYKKVFATMAEIRGFYRSTKRTDEDVFPDRYPEDLERQGKYLRDRLAEIREYSDDERRAYEYMQIRPRIEQYNQNVNRRYIEMRKEGASRRSRIAKNKYLLYPRLQFEKRLDVRQDDNILSIWRELADKGWVSPRSVVQGAGLDFDAEMSMILQDTPKMIKNKVLMDMAGVGGEKDQLSGFPAGGIPPIGMAEPGAPGSAEVPPPEGPAPAASVRSEHRRITASALPEFIQRELEVLMNTPDSVDLFIRG